VTFHQSLALELSEMLAGLIRLCLPHPDHSRAVNVSEALYHAAMTSEMLFELYPCCHCGVKSLQV
jgi:hypothetical protein